MNINSDPENFDRSGAQALFEPMQQLDEKLDTGFDAVTHDHGLAGRMQRRLRLADGVLLEG
jgi:predicted ABC-type transport system involved in lysophospholipase L1 biosynthesis ATPase subunit